MIGDQIMDKSKYRVIKMDAVKVYEDIETGEFFYDQCFECDKMLNEEEAAFGHDCE